MKKFIISTILGCMFYLGVSAQGFQSNGNALYYNKGNVGIGTINPEQKLSVVGGNFEVIGIMPGLNQQGHTSIGIAGQGIRGGLHKWKMFTASAAGAWGIRSNAYEIWEYPELSNSSAPEASMRRFAIQTARDKTTCYPVIIGSKGNLNLGYSYWDEYEDLNMLSVNGNVGIGTVNTQGYKLAVNGTIRAKEVKIDTGWADFVFKKDYQLPTLQEVEQHIAEKGTLPGVPSESEVKANGVSLGETNTLLLQKIEELTLYVIQQQKEINELKSQIKK